jgi:hypothetical protein
MKRVRCSVTDGYFTAVVGLSIPRLNPKNRQHRNAQSVQIVSGERNRKSDALRCIQLIYTRKMILEKCLCRCGSDIAIDYRRVHCH